MHPSLVKTIEDLIFWEYAKMIADSAKMGNNYRFIVSRWKKLKKGEINTSSTKKEWMHEQNIQTKQCVYCGSQENLQTEHIIPKVNGGPDIADNLVNSCRKCNLEKGTKNVFDFCILKQMPVPRIVKGKYLKLVYEEHKKHGTLDQSDIDGNGVLDLLDLCAIFKV